MCRRSLVELSVGLRECPSRELPMYLLSSERKHSKLFSTTPSFSLCFHLSTLNRFRMNTHFFDAEFSPVIVHTRVIRNIMVLFMFWGSKLATSIPGPYPHPKPGKRPWERGWQIGAVSSDSKDKLHLTPLGSHAPKLTLPAQ